MKQSPLPQPAQPESILIASMLWPRLRRLEIRVASQWAPPDVYGASDAM
jgi:hypothetical protein